MKGTMAALYVVMLSLAVALTLAVSRVEATPRESERIVVVGHHFRSSDLSEEEDQGSALAQQAKQSWQRYAAAHGYGFEWRESRRDVPAEMARSETHPRWYRYKLLAEALRPASRGGMGYQAALAVQSDVLWTGGEQAFPWDQYIRGFPGVSVFAGESFAFKPIVEERNGREMRTLALRPSHAGYALDMGVVLYVANDGVADELEAIYLEALDSPALSEAKALLDRFPPVRLDSDKASGGSRGDTFRMLPLGTGFVAAPVFWTPHHFAVHLGEDDKSQQRIKDSVRAATKLNVMHARNSDLFKYELDKVPLFPSRAAAIMTSPQK